jgi:predicted ester cyclase
MIRGSLGQEIQGRDGFAGFMDMVARTHRGEVLGIAPTGLEVEYAGAAVFAFRGGKIAEVWVLGDLHGLMAQLQGSRARSTGKE